jgi:ubiquinone biosynthesis protein COQ9
MYCCKGRRLRKRLTGLFQFNWYARRLGVAGVYKATELYLIQDSSPEHEATWKFLNKRLAEAVQIHEILCKTDLGSIGPQDAVTSAFVTVTGHA